MRRAIKKLVREIVGGEPSEYYPLGRHIVVAPGVCGGRPTFTYTTKRSACSEATKRVNKPYAVRQLWIRQSRRDEFLRPLRRQTQRLLLALWL